MVTSHTKITLEFDSVGLYNEYDPKIQFILSFGDFIKEESCTINLLVIKIHKHKNNVSIPFKFNFPDATKARAFLRKFNRNRHTATSPAKFLLRLLDKQKQVNTFVSSTIKQEENRSVLVLEEGFSLGEI